MCRSFIGNTLRINSNERVREAGLGRGRSWTCCCNRGLSWSHWDIWTWNGPSVMFWTEAGFELHPGAGITLSKVPLFPWGQCTETNPVVSHQKSTFLKWRNKCCHPEDDLTGATHTVLSATMCQTCANLWPVTPQHTNREDSRRGLNKMLVNRKPFHFFSWDKSLWPLLPESTV